MVQQHNNDDNNDDNNNYNTRGNKLVTEVRLGDEDRKPSTDVDGLAVVANDHLLHRGCVRGVVLEDQGAELGQGKDPASDLQCRDACDAVDVREVGQDASGEYLSRQARCLPPLQDQAHGCVLYAGRPVPWVAALAGDAGLTSPLASGVRTHDVRAVQLAVVLVEDLDAGPEVQVPGEPWRDDVRRPNR